MNKPKCPILEPQWLTLPEAAKHLSDFSGKKITEEKILQLALDDQEGLLTVSFILVNNTMAICSHEVQYSKADLDANIAKRIFPDQLLRKDLPGWMKKKLKMTMVDVCNQGLHLNDDEYMCIATSDDWRYFDYLEESMLVMAIDSLRIGKDQYLIEDNYELLNTGVWDLSLIGNEWIEVKRRYHKLIGGPTVAMVQEGRWTGGVCLKGEDGRILKLQQVINDSEYQDSLHAELEELRQQIANFYVEDYRKESYYQNFDERMKVWGEYFAIEKSLKEKYSPMDYLPEDSVLVFRANVIKALEEIFGGSVLNQYSIPLNQFKNFQLLVCAIDKFWANENVIINDRDTHPNNEQVIEWLIEKKLSKRLAEAAATIIRPKWAGTGRKPG